MCIILLVLSLFTCPDGPSVDKACQKLLLRGRDVGVISLPITIQITSVNSTFRIYYFEELQ